MHHENFQRRNSSVTGLSVQDVIDLFAIEVQSCRCKIKNRDHADAPLVQEGVNMNLTVAENVLWRSKPNFDLVYGLPNSSVYYNEALSNFIRIEDVDNLSGWVDNNKLFV